MGSGKAQRRERAAGTEHVLGAVPPATAHTARSLRSPGGVSGSVPGGRTARGWSGSRWSRLGRSRSGRVRFRDLIPARLAWLGLAVPAVAFAVVGAVLAGTGGLPAASALATYPRPMSAADALVGGLLVLWYELGMLLALRRVPWRQPGLVVAAWLTTADISVFLLTSGPAGHGVVDVGHGPVLAAVYALAGVAAVLAGGRVAVARRGRRGGRLARRGRLGAADVWSGSSRAVLAPLAYGVGYVAGVGWRVLSGAAAGTVLAVVCGLGFAFAVTAAAGARVDPQRLTVWLAGVRVGDIPVADIQRVAVTTAHGRGRGVRGLPLGSRPGRVVLRRGAAIEVTATAGARIVIAVDDARAGAVLLARHVDRAYKTINRVAGPKVNPRRPAYTRGARPGR